MLYSGLRCCNACLLASCSVQAAQQQCCQCSGASHQILPAQSPSHALTCRRRIHTGVQGTTLHTTTAISRARNTPDHCCTTQLSLQRPVHPLVPVQGPHYCSCPCIPATAQLPLERPVRPPLPGQGPHYRSCPSLQLHNCPCSALRPCPLAPSGSGPTLLRALGHGPSLHHTAAAPAAPLPPAPAGPPVAPAPCPYPSMLVIPSICTTQLPTCTSVYLCNQVASSSQ